MSSVLVGVLIVVASLVGLFVGLNLLVRYRARAMKGKPLPELPGAVGQSIRKADKGLVYFFSPACGACRPLTPKLRAMREKNKNVFLIDVSQNLDVARALSVMATPSLIEVERGTIAAVHIGMPSQEVLLRHA